MSTFTIGPYRISNDISCDLNTAVRLGAELARARKGGVNVSELIADAQWIVRGAAEGRLALHQGNSPDTAFALADAVLAKYGAESVKRTDPDAVVFGVRFRNGNGKFKINPDNPNEGVCWVI